MAEERGEKPQNKVALSTIICYAETFNIARGFEDAPRSHGEIKYSGDQIDQLRMLWWGSTPMSFEVLQAAHEKSKTELLCA